jgi:hypothetical protein
MKVLIDGHLYMVDNFENKEKLGQTIQFIQKQPKEGTTVLETVRDGTTNEELINVLIDRITYLQNKFPCIENERALEGLQSSLAWLNKRTADREQRGVKGTQEV